jgi:flavin-dependent dehydrogenase
MGISKQNLDRYDGDYDVIIIGAGPAGMFAANELAGHNLKVLVIDEGRDIGKRH